MQQQSDQRPEGIRTHPRAASGWVLVREALVLVSVWMVALYVVSRSGGDVAGVALVVTVACFVALTAGAGLEALAMRKSWTLVVGCLVLASWGVIIPLARTGWWLALPGLTGLAFVAATPGERRDRDALRQRTFLDGRPRWRERRRQLRRALVVGMAVGVGITVLTGVWTFVSGS